MRHLYYGGVVWMGRQIFANTLGKFFNQMIKERDMCVIQKIVLVPKLVLGLSGMKNIEKGVSVKSQ